MNGSDQEQEPHSIHRTLPERVSAIEQWMRDHIRVANRGFSKNDEDHKALLDRLNHIDAHLLSQDGMFNRYNWLVRGVMLTLFFVGAIGGMFLDKEGWKMLIHFIRP